MVVVVDGTVVVVGVVVVVVGAGVVGNGLDIISGLNGLEYVGAGGGG